MLVEKIINKKENHIILPIGVEASLVIEDRENFQYSWYIRYDDFSEVVKLDEKTNSLTIPKFHKVKSFQYICNVFNEGKEEKYVIDVDIVRLFSENIPVKQEYSLCEKVSLKLDINKKFEEDTAINWQKYNEGTNKWDTASNQKILEIVPESPIYENKKYRAIVKYDEFEFTSKTYEIHWNKIIKKNPISKGILFTGDLLKLSVEVIDNIEEKVLYNWQYRDLDEDWQYINHASKKSYTVRSELLESVTTYVRCELKYGEKTIYTEPSEIIYLKRGNHYLAVEPVNDIVSVKVGNTASLEIIVKSDSPVKYRWEKLINDKYVELSSRYNTNKLEIAEVQMPDSGKYRCIVLSGDETIISEDIELKVISDPLTINAKALIAVDRKDDRLVKGKNVYHKLTFKGLMHFENLRKAINHLDLQVNVSKEMEKYSASTINNIGLRENDKFSVKDLAHIDVFLYKNDVIKLIEDKFNSENEVHKIVDLYGLDKPITNVSLLNLTNIVNEFVKVPKIYEILMKESYNCKAFKEITNKNIYKFSLGDNDLKMFFRTIKCNEDIVSIAICKLINGKEYIIVLVDENDEKCFNETLKLIKYVLN